MLSTKKQLELRQAVAEVENGISFCTASDSSEDDMYSLPSCALDIRERLIQPLVDASKAESTNPIVTELSTVHTRNLSRSASKELPLQE